MKKFKECIHWTIAIPIAILGCVPFLIYFANVCFYAITGDMFLYTNNPGVIIARIFMCFISFWWTCAFCAVMVERSKL